MLTCFFCCWLFIDVAFDEALGLLDRLKNKGSIQDAAFIQYTLYVILCKFIHITSSTGINKAITHKSDCLPCVCFFLLFFPLAVMDPRPLQHLKWSSLWKTSTAGSYYYCYQEFHLICCRGRRSASEKYR